MREAEVDFSELVGKTIYGLTIHDPQEDDDFVEFSVYPNKDFQIRGDSRTQCTNLEEVIGDPSWIINEPITSVHVSTGKSLEDNTWKILNDFSVTSAIGTIILRFYACPRLEVSECPRITFNDTTIFRKE